MSEIEKTISAETLASESSSQRSLLLDAAAGKVTYNTGKSVPGTGTTGNIGACGQSLPSLKSSDLALELKPTPKTTCIPGKSRPFFSETALNPRDGKNFEPDKSWSVLFFSPKDKEMKSNL